MMSYFAAWLIWILSGDGYQGSGMEQYEPDSSEVEVSTTAGDGAEDLEFGKRESGPREGAEDTEPREGTIAEETLLRSLDALFLPLLPAFLSECCYHLKFVNERMCHIFSQKP